MHFIYYINRLTATKVDSTYSGCLINQQYTAYMSVAGLERMTTGSAVSALSYRATQVDYNKKKKNLLLHQLQPKADVIQYSSVPSSMKSISLTKRDKYRVMIMKLNNNSVLLHLYVDKYIVHYIACR